MVERLNNFWSKRAEDYTSLKWITDKGLIDSILKICESDHKDLVLDLGTGSGIIARAIQPMVDEVVGMDISHSMMNKGTWENISKLKGNILKNVFQKNTFNIIVARMVFHHIKPIEVGLNNCYRILKNGGKLVIAESIPPSNSPLVINWWKEVRSLKEERTTFTSEMLRNYFIKAGFKNVIHEVYKQPKETSSTQNWLSSSGLSKEIQDQIYHRHLEAPQEVKDAHEMEITNDDIKCVHYHCIIKGEK
jgi:ubiquinone/menaquinone biosynthesis C-methylase UbiE